MLSPEGDPEPRIETKATDLSVQFIAGRTTHLPQALWHSESRSIWVRGVYRRGEKGASSTTHVKMKIQPLDRMYPSSSLSVDGQTNARSAVYKQIAKGFNDIDTTRRPQTPNPHKKLATVLRMRIQGEKQTDVEQAFGGAGDKPKPFYFEYQKVSSEPGIIRLGACFFTKVELIDSDPLTGEPVYIGRYEVVPGNHTDHWTPEIRLIVPTTYSRYIEKTGEKNIAFINGLEYRSDCGSWIPVPMESSMDEASDSQYSSTSSEEEEDEEEEKTGTPPMGLCSPISKPQKRSCKRYRPGRLSVERAKKIIEEFLPVQEWMDTDNMIVYSTMVADMLGKRALKACGREEPAGGESGIRTKISQPILVNEGALSIEDMNEQLRKMWGCMIQLENELKKTRELQTSRNNQMSHFIQMLRDQQQKRQREEDQDRLNVHKKRPRKAGK
jgi:hypothetical protein